MSTTSVVVVGGWASFWWLHAIYFDRVADLTSRWLPTTDAATRMRPIGRVMAWGFAVFGTAIFLILLAVAVAG